MNNSSSQHAITKSPTGISGLDEITRGGLPTGRLTLACGGPGCGKTVFAMHFLVNGAAKYGEPGLFVSFEESPQQLIENFRSFGFDFEQLVNNRSMTITHMDFPHDDLIETGDFTLDAMFIRLDSGLTRIGARRLVLDSMETLFSAFSNHKRLRQEINRLFQWLREKKITTVVTGEKGREELTRQGFEEYISDCVLLLDHRIHEQISKRRLRVVKYRGSEHSSDEYPFLIRKTGLSLLPITSVKLEHGSQTERLSCGIKDLDAMLEGKGYFRGSTVLISGKAGTGKSSLAVAFTAAACRRNERCLYFAFEESSSQLIRNMQSIGIDLAPGIQQGLLTVRALRPTFHGLEEHLVSIFNLINDIKPNCVILDPISNFLSIGTPEEIKSMLTRLLDNLKNQGITVLLTDLTHGSKGPEETEANVSSLVDTWIILNRKLTDNIRHRELYIVKARGMDHSHEIREMIMSAGGLSLQNLPYLSSDAANTATVKGTNNESQ